jgi:hypothetical protein
MDERNIHNGIHYFSINMTEGHAKNIRRIFWTYFRQFALKQNRFTKYKQVFNPFFKLCLNSLWARGINKCRNCLISMLDASNVKIFILSLFLPWSSHIGSQQIQKCCTKMSWCALSHVVPENVSNYFLEQFAVNHITVAMSPHVHTKEWTSKWNYVVQ